MGLRLVCDDSKNSWTQDLQKLIIFMKYESDVLTEVLVS